MPRLLRVLPLLMLVFVPALLCGQQRPQLLVLGSAHLDNPGHDVFNIHVDDVLAQKRQREVEQLVDAVAAFRPTRIALECSPAKQAEWDSRYAAFRAGKYTLTRDERDQVGLRLAAKLNLRRVDCVDYTGGSPGPDSAYDFPAYAAAHQAALMDSLMADGKRTVGEESTYLETHTLIEWYRRLNQPAKLRADNAMYFRFAQIGGGDTHPGAAWVGGWHARNMIIVDNLRLAAKPGDRVLAVFGAGHAYLLKDYASESGAFDVADTEKYLAAH